MKIPGQTRRGLGHASHGRPASSGELWRLGPSWRHTRSALLPHQRFSSPSPGPSTRCDPRYSAITNQLINHTMTTPLWQSKELWSSKKSIMKNCVNDHTCSEELDPLVRGGCIPLTMGVEQSRAPEIEEVDGRSPPSFFKALLKIVSRLRL